MSQWGRFIFQSTKLILIYSLPFQIAFSFHQRKVKRNTQCCTNSWAIYLNSKRKANICGIYKAHYKILKKGSSEWHPFYNHMNSWLLNGSLLEILCLPRYCVYLHDSRRSHTVEAATVTMVCGRRSLKGFFQEGSGHFFRTVGKHSIKIAWCNDIITHENS